MAEIFVCEFCNSDELTADEHIKHLAQLIEHTGILEAFVRIHGKVAGQRRYMEFGLPLHMSIAEVQEQQGVA